jgi:Flp pilus assembly protein TadG
LSPCHPVTLSRRGAAALEFVIAASLLFVLFLGMIEVGRAMIALGALSSAARNGARAGALTMGDYTGITTAVNNSLSQSAISGASTTVTVDGVAVTDDTTFGAAVQAGSAIAVQVSVPYANVSWLPSGVSFFLGGTQPLTESAVMRRES